MIKFLSFLFFVLVSFPVLAQQPQQEENRVPTDTQNEYENLSLTRVESQSRSSAVKVRVENNSGSGTYSIISDHHVVLTAAHVVDDFDTVEVIGRFGETVLGKVIYRDVENDFAVIKVQKLSTRDPMPFRISRKNQSSDLLGERVCYTGFPNHHDLLTLRGSIAGVDRGFIIVQTYAWMGASGSGVFDTRGNYVGTLVAVDIGRFRGNVQVVESVVWVVPSHNLDLSAIRLALRMSAD